MKRRLFKLVLFLLLGVVVNVAVAWGFTAKLEFDLLQSVGNKETIDEAEWPDEVPRHWPSVENALELHMFGWNARHFNVGRSLGDQTANQRKNQELFFVIIYEVGWPCRSLQWEDWAELEIAPQGTIIHRTEGHPEPTWWRSGIPVSTKKFGPSRRRKALPIHPFYLGFAINTIFYAAILWSLTLGPFTVRRIIRSKCGKCIKCGYDLRGADHEGCPECGWGREAKA